MTTQFFDCMIDVESMGKGADAALVALGAAFFDIRTQTIGPTFLRTINLATAVRDGAHNALEDAKFQVEHLWKIANRNKAKNA